MPIDFDPDKGLCFMGIIVNAHKLGSGLPTASVLGNDEPVDVIIWDANGRMKPTYNFLNIQYALTGNGTPVLKGDMYITFPRREDMTVDPRWYAQIQAIPDRATRLNRRSFVFGKCMHAHELDVMHINENLLVAIVGVPDDLNFPRKFAHVLTSMYELGAIPDDDMLHECAFCKAISEEKMKQCACKRGVRYCSVECQRRDWAEHKRVCSQVRE